MFDTANNRSLASAPIQCLDSVRALRNASKQEQDAFDAQHDHLFSTLVQTLVELKELNQEKMEKPEDIHQLDWDEWVIKSGIDPEIAVLNLKSTTASDLTHKANMAELPKNAQIKSDGWYVQSDKPNDVPMGLVVKPRDGHTFVTETKDSKGKVTRHEETVKYLNPRKQETLPIFPVMPLYDIDGGVTKRERFYWENVIADTETPIYVTEGVKKAASIMTLGFPSFALPGVWNCLEQKSNRKEADNVTWYEPINKLKPFLAKNRKIVFVFDSDFRVNPHVLQALQRQTKAYHAVGCQVYVALWSGSKGFDDLLASTDDIFARQILQDDWALPFNTKIEDFVKDCVEQSFRAYGYFEDEVKDDGSALGGFVPNESNKEEWDLTPLIAEIAGRVDAYQRLIAYQQEGFGLFDITSDFLAQDYKLNVEAFLHPLELHKLDQEIRKKASGLEETEIDDVLQEVLKKIPPALRLWSFYQHSENIGFADEFFWQWDHVLGIWKRVKDSDLKGRARKIISSLVEPEIIKLPGNKQIHVMVPAKLMAGDGLVKSVTGCQTHILELTRTQKVLTPLDNEHLLLPVLNGDVDWLTRQLSPPDKSRFVRFRYNFIYDPSMAQLPQWVQDLFVSMVGEDQLELLRTLIRHALTPGNYQHHKFFNLLGERGSGKGTLISLVQSLMPKPCNGFKFTTAIRRIDELNNEEGIAKYVLGRKLLVMPDLNTMPDNIDGWLSITGGDNVEGRRLYATDTQEDKFKGVMMTASTKIPKFEAVNQGMERRIIILALFPRQGEAIIGLDKKLEEVRDYIANWALAQSDEQYSLNLAKTYDRFARVKAVKENFDFENLSSVKKFVNETMLVIEDKDLRGSVGMTLEFFREAFYVWAKHEYKNRAKNLSKQAIEDELKSIFTEVGWLTTTHRGANRRYFRNPIKAASGDKEIRRDICPSNCIIGLAFRPGTFIFDASGQPSFYPLAVGDDGLAQIKAADAPPCNSKPLDLLLGKLSRSFLNESFILDAIKNTEMQILVDVFKSQFPEYPD